MESKLIILLMFASLSQGSYIPKWTVPYPFSKQQVVVLDKIIVNKDVTAAAYSNAIKDLFEIFFDLEAQTDDDCSNVFDVIISAKETIDVPLDTIKIGLKNCFSDIEDARKASYDHLHDTAVEITAAFKLSQSGNYHRNKAAIKGHEAKAEEGFTNLVRIFYDVIRTCSNTTDSDISDVIKTAQEGSRLGLVHLNHAVFNAIRVRTVSFTFKCANRKFIHDLEEFREKALQSAEDTVDYKFSTLKTFYVYPHLKTSGIVPVLFSIQYAVTVAYRRCKEGNDVSFNTVTRFLTRIDRGLEDDGEVVFSRTDIAAAKATALYNSADYANVKAIMGIYPESISTITAAQTRIIGANVEGGAAYFNAVREAAAKGANYTEVKVNIATLRKAVVDLAPHYTAEYFTIIHNNQTFDNKTETKLNTLLDTIIHAAVYATNTFLDAVDILADATHRGNVSKKNFSAVRYLLNESNFAVAEYSQGVSAMSLTVLVANNKN